MSAILEETTPALAAPQLQWEWPEHRHWIVSSYGSEVGTFFISRSHYGRHIFTCRLHGLDFDVAKGPDLFCVKRQTQQWYEQVWHCVQRSKPRKQLDPAVNVTLQDAIALKEQAAALADQAAALGDQAAALLAAYKPSGS